MGNESSYEMEKHQQEAASEKLQNGDLNGHVVSISRNEETNKAAVQQNGGLPTPPITKDTASKPDSQKTASTTAPQAKAQPPPSKPEPPAPKASEIPASQPVSTNVAAEGQGSTQPPPAPDNEVEPKPARVPLFNKFFKKKTEDKDLTSIVELDVSEGQTPAIMTVTINGLQSASPSKTSKEEASPDAPKDMTKGPKEPEAQAKLEKGSPAKTVPSATTEPKDQEPNPKDSTGGAFSKLFRQKSFKDTQPTTTNGVQEVDAAKAAKTAPLPEPPKAETKAEPTAKSTQKEGPKDTPSGPVTSKKPAKSGRLSKLFSSKPAEKEPAEEQQQEEEVKVEEEEEGQTAASKASTLEASPQPEQPPKPIEKKKSNLISLFKTKAPETVKDTLPEAPPLPELTASTKAKEEPKPSAEAEKKKGGKQEAASKAKTPEVTVDNKPVPEALPGGDDVIPSISKKLEKRNSMHLFFKSLGPKRLSEVGVQTDPVTITYTSEKAK